MKKTFSQNKSKFLRQSRNGELLRRMRDGDNLTSFTSQSSWYPPRPTIEKDKEALERLYGKAVSPERLTLATENERDGRGVEKSVLPLRLDTAG